MNPYLALVWHFCGLVAVVTGASMLAGWPGGLIVIGVWAVLGTMFDAIARLLK